MKISIITICYNSQNSINKTIESVKSQTINNLEYIIIDGGSNDKTVDIIKSHEIVDKLISEKDSGIYNAFNKGLKKATGDIIGFLNSDDVFYEKDSLKKILNSFDDDIDCVFGDLIYSNIKNETKRIWKGSKFKKGTFKKGWMPLQLSILYLFKEKKKFHLYLKLKQSLKEGLTGNGSQWTMLHLLSHHLQLQL